MFVYVFTCICIGTNTYTIPVYVCNKSPRWWYSSCICFYQYYPCNKSPSMVILLWICILPIHIHVTISPSFLPVYVLVPIHILSLYMFVTSPRDGWYIFPVYVLYIHVTISPSFLPVYVLVPIHILSLYMFVTSPRDGIVPIHIHVTIPRAPVYVLPIHIHVTISPISVIFLHVTSPERDGCIGTNISSPRSVILLYVFPELGDHIYYLGDHVTSPCICIGTNTM